MDVTERYRSRDMRGSKVFRKAIDLFGESSIIRKRLFTPVLNDQAAFNIDEQALAPSSLANSVYAKPRVFPERGKKDSSKDGVGEAEVDEYHKWLERRKGMRAQLEQLGNVEKWLTGKECTPSERKLLHTLQSHNTGITSSTSILDDGQVLVKS